MNIMYSIMQCAVDGGLSVALDTEGWHNVGIPIAWVYHPPPSWWCYPALGSWVKTAADLADVGPGSRAEAPTRIEIAAD